MGLQITDGKGRGFLAEVNASNELVSNAASALERASALGQAFSWDSAELDIDIGDTMLFVKNLGDALLHLDSLIVNGSNVVCTWDVGLGAAVTTPAGTVVTGVNQNGEFSTQADVTALSDETAVADASVIRRVKSAISETKVYDLSGVILGNGQYIQVNQETESTAGSVILIGHFAG